MCYYLNKRFIYNTYNDDEGNKMFDPRLKNGKEGNEEQQSIVWCTQNVEWAIEARKKGIILRGSSNPFFDGKTIKLRGSDISFEYTEEEIDEKIKVHLDIIYFAEQYAKLRNTNKEGFTEVTKVILYPHQRKMLEDLHDAYITKDVDRFLMLWSRQGSKTTTIVIFMVWLLITQNDFQIAILANRGSTAEEVLDKVKATYEEVPFFLQAGVDTMNQSNMSLDNKSLVMCRPTSMDALNGFSPNVLYIDEFSFIFDGDIVKQKEFMANALPVVAATRGINIISSTPNGRDLFYEYLNKTLMIPESLRRKSGVYQVSMIPWNLIPGRDQAWADARIHEHGIDFFKVQYELCFDIESDGVLASHIMKQLVDNATDFIHESQTLHIMNKANGFRLRYGSEDFIDIPQDKKKASVPYRIDSPHLHHISSVDLAEGGGGDYTTMQTFELHHTIVDVEKKSLVIYLDQSSVFENNTIPEGDFADLTVDTFNGLTDDRHKVVVEYNNYGETYFVNIRHNEKREFGNTLWVKTKHAKTDDAEEKKGVKTNKTIKATGVQAMKRYIEGGAIRIKDRRTVDQITHFKKKNGVWKADIGHDDLVTPIVNLSYIISINNPQWRHLVNAYLESLGLSLYDWKFAVTYKGIESVD